MTGRWRWGAPVVLLVLVVLSLAGRLWGRGSAYTGIELILPADGLYAVATQPLGTVLRDGLLGWATGVAACISAPRGLLTSVVPGALTWLIPGRGWVVAWNLALTAAALALLLTACRAWTPRGVGMLAAALLGSGMFLNTATFGYPRITGLLPHGLALWLALRCRRSVVWACVGGLGLVALVPQLYESGKAAPVTLLVAAVLVPGALPTVRLVWVATGAASLALSLVVAPTQPTGWFLGWALSWLHLGPLPALGALPLDRHDWLTGLPTAVLAHEQFVPLLGAVAVCWAGRDRWFLGALWGLHAAFAAFQAATPLLTATGYRLLVWECYATALLVAAATGARGRRVVAVLALPLALLAARQGQQLARFLADPPYAGPNVARYTLPLPPVSPGWDLIRPAVIRWESTMLAQVRSGARLWLVDGRDCYDENWTAPLGVPEALYLALGHPTFVAQVAAFSAGYGYARLPFRPMAAIPATLAADPDRLVWVDDCHGTAPDGPEILAQLAALRAAGRIVHGACASPAP